MDDIFKNGGMNPNEEFENEGVAGTQTNAVRTEEVSVKEKSGNDAEVAPKKRHRRTKVEMAAARAAEAEAQAAAKEAEEDVDPDDCTRMPLARAIFEIGLELNCPKSNEQYDAGTGKKFPYRNVENILEALRPYRRKYGILITFSSRPEIVGNFNYITVTATVSNLRGESMSVTSSAREDVERPGNWAAQISGSCESYAKKYCLQSIFMIDDRKLEPVLDPDAQRWSAGRVSREEPAQAPAQKETPAPAVAEPVVDTDVEQAPLLSRGLGDWMARVSDAANWVGTREEFVSKILRNYRIGDDDLEILLASLPQ